MISPKEAIALADRSDDPPVFLFVHRVAKIMRESAAEPVEYAGAPQDLSPEQEEALYLAEQVTALEAGDEDLVGASA